MNAPTGRLLIVSTPIGNLEDLSARARKAFERSDRVACEDTRRTGLLLSQLGIKRPLVSLFEHNERQRLSGLLADLEGGKTLALASDAGTPLVSDPGFLLVREAAARGIPVEPIPGPSAVMAALVASGLPPLPFTFAGFPPSKAGKRKSFYRTFAALDHTVVFFESPHRIVASLHDALEQLGDRPAVLAREITKLHEEFLRGLLSEIIAAIAVRGSLKGELVLVVGPSAKPPSATAAPERRGKRHP